MSTTEEYLEIPEVAKILGITSNALALQRHRGEGPPYIKIHRRRVVYRKQAVLDWLNSQEIDPNGREALQ